MAETRTPPMGHYKYEDGPLCTNNSPVTFERKGDVWVAVKYDSSCWGKHEYDIGKMICEKCKAFVSKVPVTRIR